MNALLQHNFGNGNWQHRAYFSRNVFDLYSNFSLYLKDPQFGDEINQFEKRNLFGYSTTITKNGQKHGVRISNIFSAGIRYDGVSPTFLSHVVRRNFLSYTTLGKVNEANLFAHIQKQITFNRWSVNGSVRFDHLRFGYTDYLHPSKATQSAGIVSPKIIVQYTSSGQLQLFGKVGKGFHSNDSRIVATRARNSLPAAYGADFGATIKPSKKFYLQATAWYLYLQQEFVYVGDDAIVEPAGKTQRIGIDLSGRWQVSKAFFASANFNVARPRLLEAEKLNNYIPLAPNFTSTGGVYYKKTTGINGSLSYRYMHSRPANETNTITAKGYWLTDAAVNYSMPAYEISLVAENLLNATWNEAQFATESRLQQEPAP